MDTLYSIENSMNDRKTEIAAEAESRRLLKEIVTEDNNRSSFIRVVMIVLIALLMSVAFISIAYAGNLIW